MGLVTGISVLALCVTVAIAFRELGWRGAPRLGATLLVAGLALWTEPAQRALFLGQVEILLMALVTWDLCQPDGRRMKGAATGLAAGVKLVPLLFIAYLLLTRRFRQGAVATAAFAVTVVAGFAAFPSASVTWWLGGDFLAAGRTGFVGGQQNQSLRGALTRLAGSVNGAQPAWLIVAAWPDFWSAKASLLQGRADRLRAGHRLGPRRQPAYAEYHWHGPQLLAGNLELLAGLGLFAVALAAAFGSRRRDRKGGSFSAGLPHAAGIGTASRSGPGDCP
jgi:hypothetical protein